MGVSIHRAGVWLTAFAAVAFAAACKPAGNTRPAARALATAPVSDLDRAFTAAFGQGPPAVRVVNRDGAGDMTLRYRPLGLVDLGDRTALVSGGWTDSCHACSGSLAVHYLRRDASGFHVIGAWPEIASGASFGEPPQWKVRQDLFPGAVIVTEAGGAWQGCTVLRADLVELTRDRPIVRARNVLLDYGAEGADTGPAHGELQAGEVGRSFKVRYAMRQPVEVTYIRDGDAYQPEKNEPVLPSC